jgi:hypothetical protein
MKYHKEVIEIPEGFIPYTDDSKDYPEGISRETIVTVIIRYNEVNFPMTGEARSFGWNIRPAPNSCGGIATSAPITHYRIGEWENGR